MPRISQKRPVNQDQDHHRQALTQKKAQSVVIVVKKSGNLIPDLDHHIIPRKINTIPPPVVIIPHRPRQEKNIGIKI